MRELLRRAPASAACLLLAATMSASDVAAAPEPTPAAQSAQKGGEGRIDWWRQARFGMFIHWGLYAIPGRGEWVQWNERIAPTEYAKLATQFRANRFDPDAWAR